MAYKRELFCFSTIKGENMKKNKFISYTGILITSIFIGCSFIPSNESNVEVQDRCIEPEINFSFPINNSNEFLLPNNVIEPKSPWISALLPEGSFESNYFYDKIVFSRINTNAVNEIWILRTYQWGITFDEIQNTVLIYQPSTKIWQEIPVIFDESKQKIDHLYISESGEVWILGQSPEKLGLTESISDSTPVISLFNFEKQTFELTQFSQELPKGVFIFDEHESVFWVFNNNEKSIYTINLLTKEIIKELEFEKLNVISATLSTDESIFFLNYLNINSWDQNSFEVLKLNTENKSVEKISINNPQHNKLFIQPFRSIYSDAENSLWLGNQMYRTIDGTWYEILESPIFVTHIPESGSSYSWDLPKIVFESSDGTLWFSSYNGIVSLNKQEGKWCWITTLKSNISFTEDSDHNLWMIADNKLYKLPLGEQ